MPETGLQSVHLDIHLLDSANAVEAHTGRHPARQRWTLPRGSNSKLIQMATALPTRFCSGNEAPENGCRCCCRGCHHHEIVAFRHHPLVGGRCRAGDSSGPPGPASAGCARSRGDIAQLFGCSDPADPHLAEPLRSLELDVQLLEAGARLPLIALGPDHQLCCDR